MDKQMKNNITFHYGSRVIVLPGAVLDQLDTVSADALKVLLQGAAGTLPKETTAEMESALAFWERAGVLSVQKQQEQEAEPSEETLAKATDRSEERPTESPTRARVIVKRSDELPSYSAEELSTVLERRGEATLYLNECQHIFGKIFNTREINIVIGLVDYLGLAWDYVFDLLRYCVKIDKRSLRYAEKLAISFVDDGIDTPAALTAKIEALETIATNEAQVRKMFGIQGRAWTAKEKKLLDTWFIRFGYGMDIIEKAYEITVGATNTASLPYAGAILERWNSEGLKTLADVEQAIEKAQLAKGQAQTSGNGSFDTDDFFEAALQRTYETAQKK